MSYNAFDGYKYKKIDVTENLYKAGVEITASASELNITDNMPANITFAAAAGGANVCEVTCTVRDAAGATIAASLTVQVTSQTLHSLLPPEVLMFVKLPVL